MTDGWLTQREEHDREMGKTQQRYDELMAMDMPDLADLAAECNISDAFMKKADMAQAIVKVEWRDKGRARFGHMVTETGNPDTDGTIRWSFPPETAQQTEMAQWLLQKGLPEFLDHFLSKNADYGDEHLSGRGPAGEFIGIERKVGKLGSIRWEGQEMNHEGADEILRDLIGSCLLVLHMRSVGYTGRKGIARSE